MASDIKNKFAEVYGLYCSAKEIVMGAGKGAPAFNVACERQAIRLKNGYFTIAVVGRMSAGKSMFINSLLGKIDLLPTGYFQSTNVPIVIRDGESNSLAVHYAGEDVARVRPLPADGLAISAEIHELMAEDGLKIDEIELITPLPEQFRGWNVIDTPGFDGDDELYQRTIDLLNEKDVTGASVVDIVVFVINGRDNIESKTNHNFVKKVVDSLSEEKRKKLLFVITHSSDGTFKDNREGILQRANSFFIEKYELDKSRLVVADSLCERFFKFIDEGSMDLMQLMYSKESTSPSWKDSLWEKCTSLLITESKALPDKGLNCNNETLREAIQGYSNFGYCRAILGDIMLKERFPEYRNVMYDLRAEVAGFIMAEQDRLLSARERDFNMIMTVREAEKDAKFNVAAAEQRMAVIERTKAFTHNFGDRVVSRLDGMEVFRANIESRFGVVHSVCRSLMGIPVIRGVAKVVDYLTNALEMYTQYMEFNTLLKHEIDMGKYSAREMYGYVDEMHASEMKLLSVAEDECDRVLSETSKSLPSESHAIAQRVGDLKVIYSQMLGINVAGEMG